MNKTLPIWHDNVVAVHLLSNRLLFLKDRRDERQSEFVADLYEQELVPNPKTDDVLSPCFLKHMTEDQVPLSFLQSSGGQCWRLAKKQEVRGYQLILEKKRLSEVVGVSYRTVYYYHLNEYKRSYLEKTDEKFAFKEWSDLKAETFFEGRRVVLVPVYRSEEADDSAYFVKKRRVFLQNGAEVVAVRCFGVNVYDVSPWGGAEKFAYFLPTERLSAKGIKDLRL